MSKTVIINPVTRISGFMQVQVEIENFRVVDAKCSGLLFRGFELMLKGREPLDAIYFTERICGICSAAHGTASSMALEDTMGIKPGIDGKMLRDFIHCCEFIQNHLRHFYQYTMPDFVRIPALMTQRQDSHSDFRLPEHLNKRLSDNYTKSIQLSREAHKLLSIIGGKAPHNHGILPGGAASGIDASKLTKIKAGLNSIKQFFFNNTIDDIYIISEYYGEYFNNGAGCKNLMTYGLFDYPEQGIGYVKPKVLLGNSIEAFDPDEISENVYNSWYLSNKNSYSPTDTVLDDDPQKPDAYSWIKAPRYKSHPVEVGPLARMILSGSYRNRISTMDRYISRVMEIKKIIETAEKLIEAVDSGYKYEMSLVIPERAQGKGLTDTTRGALGHWISIEGKHISNYQIITPSAWNLSPADSAGIKGVVEQALIGTEVDDPEKPVEIGRIVRSFDPCISCATHVICDGSPAAVITVP